MNPGLRYITSSSSRFHAFSSRNIILVGKSKENDIVIENDSIPQYAAQFEYKERKYILTPVGDTAIRVNGKKVGKVPLSPGDRIEIGGSVFIYDVQETITSAKSENDSSVNIDKFISSVGKERNLHTLLNKLVGIIKDIFNGSDAFIFKLDHDGKPQVFVSSGNDTSVERFSDTVVQSVVTLDKGLYISNALADPAYSKSRSIADLHLRSVMCVPIMIAGKKIGVLYIGSNKNTVSYTNENLTSLSTYAAIAGMLINHVDFISQQQSALQRLTNRYATEGIITESKIMSDLLAQVEMIALSDITVLIEGATGTGKNSIAQLIHKRSTRGAKPMIIVNCSSLRGELLESELFGHKRGAFTGAIEDHEGLFSVSDGGTLLLDEIGELELPLQAKILRTIESGMIRPLGAASERKADVRILCATNKDLLRMVEAGKFRADLYYRINQYSIRIPALKDRENDPVLIAYYLLEKYKNHYPAKEVIDFHPDTLRFISSYDWPGNIRELSNMVHTAILMSKSPLLAFDTGDKVDRSIPDFEAATKEFQHDLIKKAIELSGGNKEEAAKKLGISRSSFFRYQASLGMIRENS